MKKLFAALGLAVVALPLAIVVTFLLIPFWRWLEATTAIESIGHSGPSDWCFVAIYTLMLAAGFGTWIVTRRKK